MKTKLMKIKPLIIWLTLTWLLGMPRLATSTITITDDTGQNITLNGPAKRIVSLYGGITETVCALGFCDRLVGVTKRDRWPKEVLKKKKVGTHMRPNLEIILGLRPDIVLQGSVRPGSQIIVQKLRLMGIPVAIFNPVDFKGLFQEMKMIGRLCGNEKKAADLISKIKSGLLTIEKKYPLSKRPKVVFEVSYPNLLVAGKRNFVTDIINKAGGMNPISKEKKLVKLSFEALISISPDVYVIQKGPMNPLDIPVEKRPNFCVLKAIREKRSIVVDEFLFSRPTPRAIEAVKLLRAYLYKFYPKNKKDDN